MSHRTGSGARSGLMSSRIRKPVFTQELENKKCSDGEKVTLECRVTSNTRPQVSWHKDGKQLRQSKDFKMFFDGELARLDIVEAFLDDEGEYCCKATSPFGEAKTSCRLSVKDGNIPASKPPPKSLVSKAEPKTETKMDIKLKSTAREESKLKSPSREELRTEGRLKSATSREDVKLDLKVRTSPRDTKPQQNGARPKGVKAMASRSHLLDDKRRNYTKEVKPSFIIKPRRQFVDDGLVAKFKASFDGSPAPEISWEKEGKTIPNSGRYRYFKERDFHYLEISDVTVDDKGTYVCVIQNSVGRETASAELDVYVRKTTRKKNPPKFDIPLKDKKVPDGESLTLECLISGSPEPTVSWYLSGKVLKSSEDIKQTFDGKTAKLVFVEVFPDDEGTYECVATNANGEVRCKCKLTVEDPKPAGTAPSISSGLSDQVSHDGDKVVFTCTIQGQPEPEIKWFKAGKQIKENQDFKMMFDGTIAKLEIMEVFPEDDGDYACVATNAFGEDKSKCKLTVKDPEPKVKPKPKAPEPAPKTTKSVSKEPPKFATELKNITVNDGDKVEMTVKVTGTPPIDICWLHGDKEVKKTDPVYQLKSQGQFHTLTVPEVYPEDAGTYICEAYNDYGDTDTMCTLTVRDKAAAATSAIANQNGVQPVENDMANDIEAEEDIENEFYPPEFIRKPKSASVDEGNSAKFSCQIGGNPAPHVTWEKDGKPLTNGGRFKIASDGILRTFEISHTLATDAGRYGIRAKNTEGVEKYSVSLMVKELENSENLDFRSLLKARPSLGKIGSSSSTESEKEAEQHDFRAVLTRHVKTKERPTIKQELEDVRATEGDSVTLECRISGVPKPKLIWYLGKKEIKESKFFKMSYEGSMARLVIAEVYPEDEGEYTVKATNDAGTAKSSCDVYVQDLPMEDSPRDRRASSSQGPGVQEEPPFIEEISPENVHVLRGSKVQIRAKFCGEPGPTVVWMKGKKEIPSGGAVKIDIIRDTTVLTIQNVQPDHSGRYTLCLESPLGSDRAAVSVTVEDKPNAPSGKPHASTVTKNSMTLSWYGPSYDGGSVVSDYRVEICKGPDGDWKTLTSSCKSTSYSVKSLEPNAEYIFRISAANKHGFSEPGQESDVYVTTDRRPSGWQENDPAPSRTDGKQADDTLIIPRNVAIDPNRNFSDHYLLKEEIGKGRFGNVYRCMEKESGREWAAKFIKVKLGDKSETKNEIDVMNSLRHSKLLMLWDAFESKREMVLVMEHVAGGELFERIIDEDYILTERECVHFMKQICDAIKYMHDENILHLDMKPENVLCITKNSNEIKLIDFGLARKYDPNQNFRVMFGTPEFVAPEVVNYDQVCHKTDMWSVGVICYILLSGLSPFMGEHDRETLVNVTMAQWDFEAEEFNDISEDAKDFIEGLLVKRKEKRMSAEECLSHKWLSQDVKYMRAKRLSTEKHKRFMARRKWQKTGNAIRALGRMASLQKAMGSLGQRSRGDSLGNATGKRSSGSQRPSRSSGPELVAECDENSSQDETTTLENEVSQTSIRVKQNNTPRNESSTKDNEPSFKSSATLSLSTNSLGTRVRGAETNGAANREIHNGRDDRNGRENGLSDRSMQLQTDMRRSLRPARSGIAPKFTKKMKDVEVIEGDIARFDVEFSGDPYPQLTWYKDGEEVQDSSHFVFEEEEGHHSLIIKDCMEEDDAEYECKIVNTAGKATCQGELYVAPLGENA